MATQLFLRGTSDPDTHLGTDNANLRGTTNLGWSPRSLSTSRGSGVTAGDNTDTVAGPTLGVEHGAGGSLGGYEYISPPVAADVTISGTITANIWASESNMSANVSINIIVEVIRAATTTTRNSNTLVEIGRTARTTTEVAVTTRSANNFTLTPTSTVVNRGDRLRVRVFGDDGGSASMAATYTFNISTNGATAAADGDSYVTFTETVTFESAPGTVEQATAAATAQVGNLSTTERRAQPFVAGSVLQAVRLYLYKFAAPTDNFIVELQGDSGGAPDGVSLGTIATVAAASLTGTPTYYTYSCNIATTPSSTYWIVARRSGAIDAVNYYGLGTATSAVGGWSVHQTYNGSSWSAASGPLTILLTSPSQFLYLTDTASAVATASVDKEAWTSRGSGVTSIVTNTSTGWTAPVQATDTAGGTVVDWFTRPLTAFTLTGMAVLNIRALESNAAANASLRCEIARVEGDGTSPTVWASWCCAPTGTDNGELTTSEVARTINLSGDDLAISDGQRLRIRLYNEDISSAAMVTGHTVTRYYAGTSGGASGDTYITFSQVLTEYSAAAPAVFPFVNAPVFGRWP